MTAIIILKSGQDNDHNQGLAGSSFWTWNEKAIAPALGRKAGIQLMRQAKLGDKNF